MNEDKEQAPVAEIVRSKTCAGRDYWDIKIFDKDIQNGTKLYAHPSVLRERIAGTADSVGNWIWRELMDYCKERGISPSNNDRLFELVKRARIAFKEPVYQSVNTAPSVADTAGAVVYQVETSMGWVDAGDKWKAFQSQGRNVRALGVIAAPPAPSVADQPSDNGVECNCGSNPHAENCPVTAHVRALFAASGESARCAPSVADAPLTWSGLALLAAGASEGQADEEFCKACAEEWQDTLKEQSDCIKARDAELTALRERIAELELDIKLSQKLR